MFEVLYDTCYTDYTYSAISSYKVIDFNDLVVDIVSGSDLLQAVKILGDENFTNVRLFRYEDVEVLDFLDTSCFFNSLLEYHDNSKIKLDIDEHGDLNIKFIQRGTNISFSIGERYNLYVNDDILLDVYPNVELEDLCISFASIYNLDNRFYKLTYIVGDIDITLSNIFVYIDSITGLVCYVSHAEFPMDSNAVGLELEESFYTFNLILILRYAYKDYKACKDFMVLLSKAKFMSRTLGVID